MVSLEQVKLLEAKVSRTIDYVKKVTDENTQLKDRLSSYQKRIDELEVLITRFKQDQGRIEDGILSALDRLNQFEGALQTALSTEEKLAVESKHPAESKPVESKPAAESKPATQSAPAQVVPAPFVDIEPVLEEEPDKDSGELDIF